MALALLVIGLAARGIAVIEASYPLQHDASEKIDWSVLMPDGDGRTEVLISCTGCHDLRLIIPQRKSRAGWSASVQNMISAYQAPLDAADIPAMLEYLEKNFGEGNPIECLPININSASVEALARLPGIDKEMAKAIVELRQRSGPFQSVDDLRQTKGLGPDTLKKIKQYIAQSQ